MMLEELWRRVTFVTDNVAVDASYFYQEEIWVARLALFIDIYIETQPRMTPSAETTNSVKRRLSISSPLALHQACTLITC